MARPPRGSRIPVGLVLQGIAAFWSCSDLYRALQTHTPEELRLKRQFALVFLRWIAVIMVTYMGVGFIFGRFAAFFFVAIYTAATIVIDVAPDRFLRAMPGGAEDADPLPGEQKRRLRRTYGTGSGSNDKGAAYGRTMGERNRRPARLMAVAAVQQGEFHALSKISYCRRPGWHVLRNFGVVCQHHARPGAGG